MSTDKDYRDQLESHFVSRQKKNSAYSKRAFARDLGISPTALTQVLNKKRHVSPKNLDRITNVLKLGSVMQSEIKKKISDGRAESDGYYTLVNAETFESIAAWYHFAILCLAETGRVSSDPEQIANLLKISRSDAAAALSRLIKLGMISKSGSKIIYSDKPLLTTTDIPSDAIKRQHLEHLALAAKAIGQLSLAERDFSTITLNLDPSKLPKAKEKIRTFRRSLCKFLETKGPGAKVGLLSIQLFPISGVIE